MGVVLGILSILAGDGARSVRFCGTSLTGLELAETVVAVCTSLKTVLREALYVCASLAGAMGIWSVLASLVSGAASVSVVCGALVSASLNPGAEKIGRS
jgi:hypothetical protein